jgi:hypothetical protein
VIKDVFSGQPGRPKRVLTSEAPQPGRNGNEARWKNGAEARHPYGGGKNAVFIFHLFSI